MNWRCRQRVYPYGRYSRSGEHTRIQQLSFDRLRSTPRRCRIARSDSRGRSKERSLDSRGRRGLLSTWRSAICLGADPDCQPGENGFARSSLHLGRAEAREKIFAQLAKRMRANQNFRMTFNGTTYNPDQSAQQLTDLINQLHVTSLPGLLTAIAEGKTRWELRARS